MSGTQLGGQLAAATNKRRYGETFYADIGKIGGKKGRTGGFASAKIGADGLTGRERAAIAGQKGGYISRRGPGKVVSEEIHKMTFRESVQLALRNIFRKER